MKALCALLAALIVPLLLPTAATIAAESRPAGMIEPDVAPAGHARTVVRIGLLDFESEASYLGRRQNIQETIVRHLQANSPGLLILSLIHI